MFTLAASRAKQNFGAPIGQLAQSPVAMERHHQTVAVVMSPESAQSVASLAQQPGELRRLA